MSINDLPVSRDRAIAMRRVMEADRPDSHFDVVGSRRSFFVRETHSNGRIETHGHKQGFARREAPARREEHHA